MVIKKSGVKNHLRLSVIAGRTKWKEFAILKPFRKCNLNHVLFGKYAISLGVFGNPPLSSLFSPVEYFLCLFLSFGYFLFFLVQYLSSFLHSKFFFSPVNVGGSYLLWLSTVPFLSNFVFITEFDISKLCYNI